MTGTSAWIASDGDLRPSRAWRLWNGSTSPSFQARISPSMTPVQSSGRAASTTSGNWVLTSLRSREYRRTSVPRLWSWARMPSYLSSTQTSGPSRVRISAASSAGEASMNLSGWKRASSASSRRSSRARPARRPTSPVSMPAHLTASSGRSKALAMAASTRPSRRPMRSSPPRTLTMPLAVAGSERASRSRRRARLGAGPDGRLDRRERGGHLGECRGRRRAAARGRRRPARPRPPGSRSEWRS